MILTKEKFDWSMKTMNGSSGCKYVEGFKKIFGYCEYCRKYFKYPKRRELNTAYVNEEDNWMCSCKGCYDEVVDYYKELWENYYRDCLESW